MPRQVQNKNWVFTLNNCDPLYPNDLAPETYKFVTWQQEKGLQGTLHLQGYIIFDKKQTLGALKKLWPTAHWETRKGSHEQARDYCTKEDTRVSGPWTLGVEPKPGKRNDLLQVQECLDKGYTDEQLVDQFFSICSRNMRFFRDYRRIKAKQRSWKTEVIVLWGPTDVGKSRYCADNYPGAYWKSRGEWWDGYEGQEVVIIDEFYGWLPYDLLLRLLDRYPLVLGTKGGFTTFLAKTVVLTSNKSPDKWYDSTRHNYAPLARRIAHIYELPLQVPPPVVMATPPTQPDVHSPPIGVSDLYSSEELAEFDQHDTAPLHTTSYQDMSDLTQRTPPISPTRYDSGKQYGSQWDTDSDEEPLKKRRKKSKHVDFYDSDF